MSDETSGSAPARALPDAPNLEWLRKQAKQRLALLRERQPSARLADAQLALARELGFRSWRALKAHVDHLTLDRSEEHTSELQSHVNLVCRLLLEKKKKI